VMIEEATVDGHGCVGDENDRTLVDEEERGFENTVFGAWRNVMWRMVSESLFMLYRLLPSPLYRSTFVSGVVWSTHVMLNLVDFKGVLESS
jgi:hypothetical protein